MSGRWKEEKGDDEDEKDEKDEDGGEQSVAQRAHSKAKCAPTGDYINITAVLRGLEARRRREKGEETGETTN